MSSVSYFHSPPNAQSFQCLRTEEPFELAMQQQIETRQMLEQEEDTALLVQCLKSLVRCTEVKVIKYMPWAGHGRCWSTSPAQDSHTYQRDTSRAA